MAVRVGGAGIKQIFCELRCDAMRSVCMYIMYIERMTSCAPSAMPRSLLYSGSVR